MSILLQLERDLLKAANRRHGVDAHIHAEADPAQTESSSLQARAPHSLLGARARTLRLALIVFACLLASATIALAAGGVILSGAPVRPEGRLNPSVGEGVPAPGGSRLLSLRAADPEGGLPWGMRIVRTTRGELCVQIGRVENGQLGQLGLDGVFHDDGRFHPMPTDLLPETSRVGTATIDNDASAGVSCHLAGQAIVGAHLGVDRSAGGANGHERRTPRKELRDIYYGMLGAPAVSVSYRVGGVVSRVATLQPLGAYLIVRQAARTEQVGYGDEGLGSEGDLTPSPPLTAITYRLSGKLCERGPVLAPGLVGHLADPCPVPRWPVERYAAPRELHRLLHVRLRISHRMLKDVDLSFTAPFAVVSAKEDYEIRIPGISCSHSEASGGDRVWSGGSGFSLGRDVNTGATVAHRFSDLELFTGICGRPPHVRYVSRRSAPVEVVYRKYVGAMPVIVAATDVRLPAGIKPAPIDRFRHR